jgi:DNA primase large subunit
MSLETKFTQNDLAKYPFLKETVEHMKLLGLKIEDITSPELSRVLTRAKERLEKSVLFISPGDRHDNDIEIPSFPVAIMLALSTKNTFIKKRYALSEAKQAFSYLKAESNNRLVAIARDFDWNIQLNKDTEIPFEFSISFTDYLRNVTHLRGEKWKLINRLLSNGNVYLNQHDVARLLEEEVQRRIESRLDITDVPSFPPEIEAIASHITVLAKEKIGESEMEGFPKIVSQSAFPPCIEAMYDAASKGKHMSHIARFTLTSFLVTIGMPPEKVAEAFKTSSDYNARLTRYQVQHIAGSKGSGTKYTPPSCSTLQTHGACINSDALCRKVRHPLKYYLRKQKMTQ